MESKKRFSVKMVLLWDVLWNQKPTLMPSVCFMGVARETNTPGKNMIIRYNTFYIYI